MYDGIPLHPLIVHAPLVLGIMAPIVALILWGTIASRYLHHRVWWLAVALHLAAFAGSVLAVETGEQEEERVEQVVEHDIIHAHAEKAETYRLALGIGFALSFLAGVMFGNRKWGMRLAGVTVAAGLVAAWLAVGVGHSGGELVYQHGAANYYVDGPPTSGPRVMRAAEGDEGLPLPADSGDGDHEDDHEH